LTDFGLSRILKAEYDITTTSDISGSLRWMAPELLYGEKVSTSSDVWAFGMTILEITTGKRPYNEEKLDPVVIRQISEGKHPMRPVEAANLTDMLWNICCRCWVTSPSQRSSMDQIQLDLKSIKDPPIASLEDDKTSSISACIFDSQEMTWMGSPDAYISSLKGKEVSYLRSSISHRNGSTTWIIEGPRKYTQVIIPQVYGRIGIEPYGTGYRRTDPYVTIRRKRRPIGQMGYLLILNSIYK